MRMTDPKKWDDEWFLDLPPVEKLVWMYMCERCDIAGFYAIPKRKAAFEIGISVDEYAGAYKGLRRGFHESADKTSVWLRNFVKYQRNLPLNKWNNAHKSIIEKLLNNLDNYKSFKQYLAIPLEFHETRTDKSSKMISTSLGSYEGLMRPPSKGKGKSKGNSSDKDKGKNKYGEGQSVLLSDSEYKKLLTGWGSDGKKYNSEISLKRSIDELDLYIRQKQPKYNDHYAVMQGWVYKNYLDSVKDTPPEGGINSNCY